MGADLRPDLDDALDAFGVPAVVTWTNPENAPVTTTGIWLPALEEDMPMGTDFQRSEPRRLMALPRNEIATLPRGTAVAAPEIGGDVVRFWKVDGLARFESQYWRAILVVDRQTP